MKVLHIGDNVLFGHRFNGHDLGNYLRDYGIDSDHLVWWKNFDDENTFEVASNWKDRAYLRDYYSKLNNHYGSNALFYPFSYDLLFDPKFLDCDVVHLHLIHNSFFSIEHLPIISRLKPVVWTLHDPWALAGHCLYSINCHRWKTGCGDCPALDRSFEISQDTSALNWEFKRLMFQASDLDIIVASQWMHNQVSASPLFKNANLHLVNFGLDLDQFKPEKDQNSAKRKYGIPAENVVITFRGVSSPYKGLGYILECLRDLETSVPITLLVSNEIGLMQELSDRFQIVELGWVDDDQEMINAYEASDIFLMPSVAEAFGMMAIEAMACGKPVITMSGTSLPEVLRPEESGCIVVPQGDVDALRAQLNIMIEDGDYRRRVGKSSRDVAEKYYNKKRYLNDLMSVYQQAIDRKQGDARAQYLIEQQKRITLPAMKISLVQEVIVQKDVERIVTVFIPDANPVSNPNITEKEYRLIALIHRLKNVPFLHYSYVYVAKPILHMALKVWRFIK